MYPDASVRRVLIYRLGSLGDTVVALPCYHLIARAFPNAERRLLTNFPIQSKAPAASAVLGDCGLIHGYMRYSVGTRNPMELFRLAAEIRRFKPEVLVYLMPFRPLKNVRRDKQFFRLAGVRRLVGVPGAAELENRFDASTGLYESEASRLARSIAALGNAAPDEIANWDLKLNPSEMETAARVLASLEGRPLIACGPGCKMQANDWEKENWQALAARLSARYPSHGLVLTGAKEDFATCEFVAAGWRGSSLNLAGQLNPRESAAVFRHAQLFIGPDSGPKHLASSVGTPCVCVFSARQRPGIWFPPGDRNLVLFDQPECRNCGLETCIEMQKKCIRAITVDAMEQAVVAVLESSAADHLSTSVHD